MISLSQEEEEYVELVRWDDYISMRSLNEKELTIKWSKMVMILKKRNIEKEPS